jgi:ribonuclease HII
MRAEFLSSSSRMLSKHDDTSTPSYGPIRHNSSPTTAAERANQPIYKKKVTGTSTGKKLKVVSTDLDPSPVDPQTNHHIIIGVDEAGRGCLAGPVSVAAYWQSPGSLKIKGIKDSKLIKSEKIRAYLYNQMIAKDDDKSKKRHIEFEHVFIDAKTVDEINILQATLKGMKMCILGLQAKLRKMLGTDEKHIKWDIRIDGKKAPQGIPKEHYRTIVRGDRTVYEIAAASIIAKHRRDEYMINLAKKEPKYSFEKHKGYGTKYHKQALKNYGPGSEHRMTFSPLKKKNITSSASTSTKMDRSGDDDDDESDGESDNDKEEEEEDEKKVTEIVKHENNIQTTVIATTASPAAAVNTTTIPPPPPTTTTTPTPTTTNTTITTTTTTLWSSDVATVTFIQGDIFKSPSTFALAHCVSLDFRMGKGLAAQWVQIFGHRMSELQAQKKTVGQVAHLLSTTSASGLDKRHLFYIITKQRYFDLPTLKDFERAIRQLRKEMDDRKIVEIAIPKLGCGLDRLNWEKDVLPCIKSIFNDSKYTIHVYDLTFTRTSTNPHFSHATLSNFLPLYALQCSNPCDIPGLTLYPEVIDIKHESHLIDTIVNTEKKCWSNGPGNRRVIQYGYEYNYQTRTLVKDNVPKIPEWITNLVQSWIKSGYLSTPKDQVIINEYCVDQGITPHTDHKLLFDDEICSLSLQTGTVMNFQHSTSKIQKQIYLPPRSLLVMRGQARWDWTHAIPNLKSLPGIKPRYSLTLRQKK